MIQYTVTLNQVGLMVQVDIKAPPSEASEAEIKAADLFRKHVLAFQVEVDGITLQAPQESGHSQKN